MLELSERIRTLIDDVEPITLADLGTDQRRSRKATRTRLTLGVGTSVVVLAVLVLVASLLFTSPGGQTSAIYRLHWHLAGYTGPNSLNVQGSAGTGAYELQCPTTTTCYSTEPVVVSQTVVPNGTIEVSNDGGRTWRSVLNEPGADLSGLTCPAEFDCAVTGENFQQGSLTDTMYTTSNGGQSWTTHVLPGGSLTSSLLWCATPEDCIATTAAIAASGQGEQITALVTSDGGQTWTSDPFPGSFEPINLECQGAACVATGANNPGGGPSVGDGAVAYSSDHGTTWHLGRVAPADMVEGLTCSDGTHCMAHEQTLIELGGTHSASPVIDTLISTSDGGASWTPVTGGEPQTWLISDIECPSALDCWISGDSHPAGETLEQVVQSPDTEQGFVRVTTDGGQTWRSIPLPEVNGQPLTVIGSLSCPLSDRCFALANNPGVHTSPFPAEVVLSTGG
jgi:photosystem II stability/assembly factor-like uncharacterized protein